MKHHQTPDWIKISHAVSNRTREFARKKKDIRDKTEKRMLKDFNHNPI
jgi:hypothetical protein